MNVSIRLLDQHAPQQESQLMILDRTDANNLVDFVEKNTSPKTFSSLLNHIHFMTKHVVECDGEVERDAYVANRKMFLRFVKASMFIIGREKWAESPVVKEMALE